MKSNSDQLVSRGFVDELTLSGLGGYSLVKLEEMLKSDEPCDRTIAATGLGLQTNEKALELLILALVTEKKLYTKLAICKAIATFGGKASNRLIAYLGVIGNNQHKVLPLKLFMKKSYPLPRDIVARTLANIGVDALGDLMSCVVSENRTQVLEAIDAIGFISFYHNNDDAFELIIETFAVYEKDDLMIWKLLRCLQSFNQEKAKEILCFYCDSEIEALCFEAKRSLNQLSRVGFVNCNQNDTKS